MERDQRGRKNWGGSNPTPEPMVGGRGESSLDPLGWRKTLKVLRVPCGGWITGSGVGDPGTHRSGLASGRPGRDVRAGGPLCDVTISCLSVPICAVSPGGPAANPPTPAGSAGSKACIPATRQPRSGPSHAAGPLREPLPRDTPPHRLPSPLPVVCPSAPAGQLRARCPGTRPASGSSPRSL